MYPIYLAWTTKSYLKVSSLQEGMRILGTYFFILEFICRRDVENNTYLFLHLFCCTLGFFSPFQLRTVYVKVCIVVELFIKLVEIMLVY